MSMNGLERITEKILAEAREEADRILSSAEAECARIREEYAVRAEEIRARLSLEAEREGTDMIEQAKATAANKKRNLLLATKSQLIDEVFALALTQICGQEGEKYVDILAGLLSTALVEQVEAEEISRTLYGEEEAMAPDSYEILLSARDMERYGKDVLDAVRKKLASRLDKATLDKLVLSKQVLNASGSLVLRCGNIEANCSLPLLFTQLREELEAEVSHALFVTDNQQ